MNIIIILIILAVLAKKGKLNELKNGSKAGKIVIILLAICFLWPFLLSMIPFLMLGGMGVASLLPFIVVIAILKKVLFNSGNDKETKKKEEKRGREEKRNSDNVSVPRNAAKRTKIVEAFNKKYELCLTESDIKRIVDASYMSPEWANEIGAMSKKYETISEWYNSDTSWLRAYLYAFKTQTISSDFRQQKQICLDSFGEIFDYVMGYRDYTLEQRIEKANARFFTGFDEISFMIAFRFLEKNGRRYDFGKTDIEENIDITEKLMSKY